MAHRNSDLLELAARTLEPLLPEIVFVGGCATGLLITDPGAGLVRVTYDVDVIAEIVSYADYVVFSERLKALGLHEDTREGAPVCRWRCGELTLDVMPLDDRILGFSSLVRGCIAHSRKGSLARRFYFARHYSSSVSGHQNRSISQPRRWRLLCQP
ncbi:MAG: hypothetical protein WBC92_18970 [Terracidiphilus sp.]